MRQSVVWIGLIVILAGCTPSPSDTPLVGASPSASPAAANTPTAAPSLSAADAGRLLLVSRAPVDLAGPGSDAGYDWWVVPVDGSDPWLIGQGFQAEWSPGGSRIYLMASGPDCVTQVTSVNPDGSDATVLSLDLRIGDGGFRWSPDGRHVSFLRYREAVDCRRPSAGPVIEPWIMNADGSDQYRLTQNGGWPTWSPDGQQLGISWTDSLAVLDLAGTVLDSVGPEPGVSYWDAPTWSSDRTMLAFVWSDLETHVTLSRSDLTDQFDLTLSSDTPFASSQAPAWLPDGSAVVFAGWAANDTIQHLWLAATDNGSVRQVSPAEVYQWALSPTGESIARSSTTSSGTAAIIIMDLNGSTLAELAPGDEPRWQPGLHPELDHQ